LRPFAEAGGWTAPDTGLSFKRAYADGAGLAEGAPSMHGSLSYVFGRVGTALALSPADEMAVSAELGHEWLRTGNAYETLSSTDPFQASFPAGTDAFGVGKLRAQWTHSFTAAIDATLWVAGARAFGASSGLTASVAGFGVLRGRLADATWAEYGGRVGYKITPNATIDLIADGASGGSAIGSRIHAGAGFRYTF
jgi:hypothetical protein